MMRYYYLLDNDLKTYDSLFNAGNWNFSMKDVLEEKERR
jgi:hypothetical protein